MPITVDRKKYYNVDELAEKFEVHPTTINRLARENVIKGEKYNVDGKARWMFLLEDVAYLKDCRPGNPNVINGTFHQKQKRKSKHVTRRRSTK